MGSSFKRNSLNDDAPDEDYVRDTKLNKVDVEDEMMDFPMQDQTNYYNKNQSKIQLETIETYTNDDDEDPFNLKN